MNHTKKDLKNLLKENSVSKASNNLMTLMMIAMDNRLIDRESVMSEAKEIGLEKSLKPKNPVGRPRKNPEKCNLNEKEKSTDPKYDRLKGIRNKPVTIKLINMETGEIKIYKSLCSAMRETKHGWRYLKACDGKVDDGFKIEILNSEKLKK